MAQGRANTPLGVYLGVDLRVKSAKHDLDDRWRDRLQRGEITEADLDFAQATYSNVVTQTTIVIKAVKPAGRPD